MVTHTGSFLWVLFSGALLGLLIRAIYSELLYSSFLSIYMGPVARQVDHQAIQSILCCASITTYICDFNTFQCVKALIEGFNLGRRHGGIHYLPLEFGVGELSFVILLRNAHVAQDPIDSMEILWRDRGCAVGVHDRQDSGIGRLWKKVGR
jgi:hypothetical protein